MPWCRAIYQSLAAAPALTRSRHATDPALRRGRLAVRRHRRLAKLMVQEMDPLQVIWSRFAFAVPLRPFIVGNRRAGRVDVRRRAHHRRRGAV
jgi:hypothetical protein